jgi:hypothetical protein
MIKAPAATLAPFDKAEKPQVSPRLDASFIKIRQTLPGYASFTELAALHEGSARRQPGAAFMPVFIGFLRGCGAAKIQPQLTRTNVHRTCTPLNKTAHIDSRADAAIPICCDRHNFATGDTRGSGCERRRDPRTPSSLAVRAEGIREGAAEPAPAEELGKRWRFFPTYTAV